MANEITYAVSLTCTKGGSTVTGNKSGNITLVGNAKFANTQVIGFAADELLVFPADLVTEGVGLIWLFNLDTTNYIELSMGTGGSFAGSRFTKLKALDPPHLIRTFKTATNDPAIYAQANTANCSLLMVVTGT